jgi:hypothetical protein
MPTRPIFGEGRCGTGEKNRRERLFWSTGVMRTACQEGNLGNVGDPSWARGRDPQQKYSDFGLGGSRRGE